MLYAIYDHGVFVEERHLDEKPVLLGKPWRKFYTVEIVRPSADNSQVLEGPAIEDDHVAEIRRKVWTVRPKNADEIDAEREGRLDRLDVLALRILFNHENRLRVIERKPPITAEQFRAAMKAFL